VVAVWVPEILGHKLESRFVSVQELVLPLYALGQGIVATTEQYSLFLASPVAASQITGDKTWFWA
jgi:hypothetical protein